MRIRSLPPRPLPPQRPRARTASVTVATVLAALAAPVAVAALTTAPAVAAPTTAAPAAPAAPAAAPAAATTVTDLSSDFEDGGADGWVPRGSGVTLTNTADAAHGGNRSLLTAGRTATWNGPARDITAEVVPGTQYTFTAWTRAADVADTLRMTVQKSTSGGSDTYTTVGSPAAVTTTGWTQLSGSWTAPDDATQLVLYVEGDSATSSYYLDDVALTAVTAPPLPDGLTQVTGFGANPGKLKMFLHVPATATDKAPLVVASHYCTGTAAAFYTGSDFGVGELVKAADRLGVVMLFPESTRDGRCFDSASPEALEREGGSDPVSVKSMVDYVKAHHGIDPARVYAVGASSGAMLTQVLLGNYPDVFAAGVSFMGVPHSCFATGSSTNLWSNDCANGAVVHTGKEWGDLVRAAHPGYTGPRPRVQLWHGTDDTTISYNDLVEGVKEWTDVLGVPATPAGTTVLQDTWTRNRYGRNAIDAPVEAITVNGTGHELPKAAMAPYVLAFLGLDAAVPDPTQPEPGDGPQPLLVHDFESGGTHGWTKRGGSETVANSTAAAHGGTHSLAVTGRTASWNAPVVSLLGRLQPGTRYTVSAWMRLGAGAAPTTGRLTVERRRAGTPTYESVSGSAAVTADAWTHLTGSYTLTEDVDFLKLYAETPGTEDFLLDDVRISWLPTLPVQTDLPSLKDQLAAYWPRTGAAVSAPQLLGDHAELLKKHFNSVTPGNAMKWDSIEHTKGSPNYAEADRIVAFAQANGIGVYGHVLAWHSQVPAWVFQDDAGKDLPVDAASEKLVLDRLTAHVTEEVSRYRGKVYAWDVVNEVVSDADGETYRDSNWYRYTGLDFIRTAFRAAHEADPAAALCINDYNTTQPVKRAKYVALVKQLLGEGVPVTCVGHQMHVNIDEPVAETGRTLALFRTLGVRQRITELDVSVYTNPTDVFTTIPAANLEKQRAVYAGLFRAFLEHATGIDSVTTWGLADDETWLSSFPVNRLDAPLLFDERLQAKPAFTAVVDTAKSFTPPARTAITVDAAPEPVRRGGLVGVTGRLTQSAGGTMRGFGGAKVVVEFRARGAAAFTPVRTTVTGADGGYGVLATQTQDGTWRARYAGDATHTAASATDDVTVR